MTMPNKAAARERRDCALVSIEDHRHGVGEPRRWSTHAMSKKFNPYKELKYLWVSSCVLGVFAIAAAAVGIPVYLKLQMQLAQSGGISKESWNSLFLSYRMFLFAYLPILGSFLLYSAWTIRKSLSYVSGGLVAKT